MPRQRRRSVWIVVYSAESIIMGVHGSLAGAKAWVERQTKTTAWRWRWYQKRPDMLVRWTENHPYQWYSINQLELQP